MSGPGFWNRWDEQQRRTAVKVTGILIAFFAVYTFIACFSYLFTWQEDQSLLTDPDMISPSVKVSNLAGKWGYGLGHFLICRCFGLGSFAFVIILAAIAASMRPAP